MEEEVVKVINIKTDQSIETVKDLKKYISELRDDLVKLDKGTEDYDKTLDALIDSEKKLTEVLKAGKNEVKAAAGSYNALQQEMTALRKVWKETTDEATRNKIGERIAEINTELKGMDASIGNFQRNVGNYKSALDALNGTYATQRQELAALKQALDNLDPSTQEYAEAFQRASEITHNLAERQELLKYSSADLGDQISNIRGIATNMVAGFSAVNAAMGLFGKESEDVQKAMLKVQQAMAIVQGMQGLDGFLKRTQGLSAAMRDWLKTTNAQTTALKAETTATNVQTAATTKATVATKGLNAALKSNPIGAIIIAVTALVAAIKPLMNLFDKLSGKTKQIAQESREAEQAFKDFNDSITNLDRENRLERIRMELEGISSYKITLKEIEQEQSKLNLTEKEFSKTLWNIIENINKYNSDASITTGTLKEMGFEQDNINDLMETGMINIEESDKVMKKLAKNDAFKTLFQNAVKYVDAIKSIRQNITDLNYQAETERLRTEKKESDERKRLWEQAARERLEIEKNYQSQIQKNYGTSIRETINNYKEQLSTLEEFYNLQLKIEPDKEIKNVIQEQINEIRKLYKEYSNQNIFQLETDAMVPEISKEPEKTKKRMEKELAALTTTFNEVLKEAKENGYFDTMTSVNDTVVTIKKNNIERQINDELLAIKNRLAQTTFDIDLSIVNSGKTQEKEIEKAKIAYEGLNEQLALQISEYEQIVDFVDSHNLTPSKEYDDAKQKLIELRLEQKKAEAEYNNEVSTIRANYFNLEIEKAKATTDATIKAIEMSFEQTNIKDKWYSFLQPVPVDEEKKYLDDIYNAQLQGLTKIKEMWKQRAKDMSLTNDERVEAEKNAAQAEIDIQDLTLEHDIKTAKQREALINEWVSQMTNAVGVIGDLFGSIADYYMDDIETRKKHNQLTDKQAEEEFEKTVKPFQIAQATVSMFQGMVSAYASAMQLGTIAGPIVGSALAAAVGAMGLMNINKIKNTKYNKSDSSSSTAPVQAPQINELPVQYVQNLTNESDVDNLRNAISEGMQSANISVSVSDINEAQNRVKVRDNNSSF